MCGGAAGEYGRVAATWRLPPQIARQKAAWGCHVGLRVARQRTAGLPPLYKTLWRKPRTSLGSPCYKSFAVLGSPWYGVCRGVGARVMSLHLPGSSIYMPVLHLVVPLRRPSGRRAVFKRLPHLHYDVLSMYVITSPVVTVYATLPCGAIQV